MTRVVSGKNVEMNINVGKLISHTKPFDTN